MNSTNAEPINCPIPESVRAERRSNATRFLERWQSGVETRSGYALQKLRLELARMNLVNLVTSAEKLSCA